MLKDTYLEFSDYASYIRERAQWREDYKLLSQLIRETKRAERYNQSITDKVLGKFRLDKGLDPRTEAYYLKYREPYRREVQELLSQLDYQEVPKGGHSDYATWMLKEREHMKIKSQALRNRQPCSD